MGRATSLSIRTGFKHSIGQGADRDAPIPAKVHVDAAKTQQLPTVTEVPEDVSQTMRLLMAGTMTPEALSPDLAERYLEAHLEQGYADMAYASGERADLRCGRMTLGRPAMPPVMAVNPAMRQLLVGQGMAPPTLDPKP